MEQMRHSLTQGTALALSCFTDGSTSLERLFLTQLVSRLDAKQKRNETKHQKIKESIRM